MKNLLHTHYGPTSAIHFFDDRTCIVHFAAYSCGGSWRWSPQDKKVEAWTSGGQVSSTVDGHWFATHIGREVVK